MSETKIPKECFVDAKPCPCCGKHIFIYVPTKNLKRVYLLTQEEVHKRMCSK